MKTYLECHLNVNKMISAVEASFKYNTTVHNNSYFWQTLFNIPIKNSSNISIETKPFIYVYISDYLSLTISIILRFSVFPIFHSCILSIQFVEWYSRSEQRWQKWYIYKGIFIQARQVTAEIQLDSHQGRFTNSSLELHNPLCILPHKRLQHDLNACHW